MPVTDICDFGKTNVHVHACMHGQFIVIPLINVIYALPPRGLNHINLVALRQSSQVPVASTFSGLIVADAFLMLIKESAIKPSRMCGMAISFLNIPMSGLTGTQPRFVI